MITIPEGSAEYIFAKALLKECLSDSSTLPDFVIKSSINKVTSLNHEGYLIIKYGNRFLKCFYEQMNIGITSPTLLSVWEVSPKEQTIIVYV